MQMLCHFSSYLLASLRRHLDGRNLLVLLSLLVGTHAWAQNTSALDKLHGEVGQWVKLNLQLSENQYSFAPMDSRVKVQPCDRPLTVDLPFASRETVRVRCQSDAPWQLYMRMVLATGASAMPQVHSADSSPQSPRKVVVARQLLRRGTVVTPAMLQEVDYSGQGLDPQAVVSILDLENGEMVRDMPAGTPLRSHDVRRAVLIKQGQSVMLTVSQGSGFSITARVEALQDGKMGEQVRMKNPESGRILSGVVTGPNTARGL